MTFYDYTKDMISEWLRSRDTLGKIIENIRAASANGQIAFYPCGRHTRIILNEIQAQAPELLSSVIGCFDLYDNVNPVEGISTYNIRSLNEFSDAISLLVVTSNTFYAKEMRDIEQLTNYDRPILNTSRFDTTLPIDMSNDEILSQIEKVYNLLADQKSKATYLITWLSRVLNDEDLTYLFESEEEIDSSGSNTVYANYLFENITDLCKKETFSDLYQMRYVSVQEGDIVFDIGAYKGDTAILYAHHVGKKGRVYSFEPVKSNYDCLVENIAKNKIGDIVVPVNKACSDGSGSLKAISLNSGAPWSFLSDEEEGEEVEVVSIDEFVETNNINKLDYIKMDVEGWEYNVILGARNTIKRFNPKMVVTLYHNTGDFFTIPLLMNNIGNYHLYIRCKIEGPFGINLYCIRK